MRTVSAAPRIYEAATGVALPAHEARRQQVRGVFFGDLVATGYAIGMGIGLREDTLFKGQPLNSADRALQSAGIGLALWVIWNLVLWTQGTRRFDVIGSGAREYWEVSRISAIVFAFVVSISYVFKLEVARGFVLFTFPVGLLLLLTWRLTANRNARKPENLARFTPRAIVVTAQGEGSRSVEELSTQFQDIKVVTHIELLDISSTVDDVVAAALAEDADFIIIGPAGLRMPGLLRELAWALAGFDTRIIVASSIMNRNEPQVAITRMWGQRVALVDDLRLSAPQRFKKRALDLTLTLAAAPLWVPLILVLAMLVKCTSRGPAFYSHIRVGQDGQEFRMWKLRSMVRNADEKLAELMAHNEASGPLFKMERDPRITRLGRILRKTSLDELPQLWNVLRGDMSLVGPRPQLPSEVLQYAGHEHRRFVAQPGVTGLWQISGRAKLDWDETISLDLEYIHSWSLWLDMWVLLRTVPEVLTAHGS